MTDDATHLHDLPQAPVNKEQGYGKSFNPETNGSYAVMANSVHMLAVSKSNKSKKQ